MMTCQYRDADLLLHAHGELHEQERGRLDDHLQACKRCRAGWEGHVVDALLLRSSFGQTSGAHIQVGAGERLSATIAARIRTTPQEPCPRGLSFPAGLRVTLGILVAVVVVALLLPGVRRWCGGDGPGRRRPADCRGSSPPVSTPPAAEVLGSQVNTARGTR